MLDAVEVHPLLCAVAHLTGDFSLLRADLAPDQAQMLVPGRGLGPEQEAEARALAGQALLEHEASGAPPHELSPDEVTRVFDFLVGPSSTPQWSDFLVEELALAGTDPRAPSWRLARDGSVPGLSLFRHRRRHLGPGSRLSAPSGGLHGHCL